jgi:hypothetical protein
LVSNFTVHEPNSQMGGEKMLVPLEVALGISPLKYVDL